MAVQMKGGDFRLESLLLAELDSDKRDLFSQVANLPCGISLLVFLDDHPNTFSTVDSIAYRVDESPESVERGLKGLARLGIAKRLDVGPTVWGLTSDPAKRECVQDLIRWKNRWHARLARVERAILGDQFKGGRANCEAAANGSCQGQDDCWRCASFLVAAVTRLQNDRENGISNNRAIP